MTTTEAPTTPVGQALAVSTPKQMVADYADDFAAVLPSHITRPETWIRLAQGALKKGRRLPSGQTELERAAANNPGQFLRTLLDCARLGLEPGTEQYYLTPRPVKGRDEILGIVGYQGLIELMYRAGAVASVVAEVVRTNDRFEFRPGKDEIPLHEIDWDSSDRGDLRLVYAFARMKDGAISKVVVLNRSAIDLIKTKAQNPDGNYSPWKNTPEAMWLKSAVRQLAKWVPTSSEYIREQLRIARDVAEEGLPPAPIVAPDLPSGMDVVGGLDDEVIDADSYEGEEEEPPFDYAPGEEPFDDGFGS
jgi:recombination protein RecT